MQSEIDLPEISGSDLLEESDPVLIERGALPEELPGSRRLGPVMQVREGVCLYSFPMAGRFLVEAGRRIIIDPDQQAAANDIRAFLFGSVMGTLLHQRNLLPLHISSLASPHGVIAFTGPSGAGKSTTAGVLHLHTGWPILCDDVAVVRMISGEPVLSAGLVRLKVWKDALARMGINEKGLDRDLLRYDKFHVSAPEMFVSGSKVLDKLIELHWSDRETRQPLRGAEAFRTVINSVYRPYLSDLVGDRSKMTQTCMALARNISVVRFTRRRDHNYGFLIEQLHPGSD